MILMRAPSTYMLREEKYLGVKGGNVYCIGGNSSGNFWAFDWNGLACVSTKFISDVFDPTCAQ